eukprot:2442276-Amphidinium_carterae.1
MMCRGAIGCTCKLATVVCRASSSGAHKIVNDLVSGAPPLPVQSGCSLTLRNLFCAPRICFNREHQCAKDSYGKWPVQHNAL